MKRLEGRVALVTGAASGIGKATARRLAEEGAAVLLTDVNESLGATTTEELRATGARVDFLRHDVTSEADWEAAVAKAVEEFGSLDILVNNAGMGDLATIEETSLADWERTIAIDQTGVFLGMKTAAPTSRPRVTARSSTSARSSARAAASAPRPPTTRPRARSGR